MDYRELILSQGPSLYWRLGKNGHVDESGNGRHGTVQSAPALIAGALRDDPDEALDLDGVLGSGGDIVYTTAYNPFAGARTFTGWAWRDTSTTHDTLVAAPVAFNFPFIYLVQNTQNLAANIDGVTTYTWTNAWPGNGQWVHYAVEIDVGADTGEVFINGVSKGLIAVTAPWSAAPGGVVMGGIWSGGSTQNSWDGRRDEFAIFERLLTPAEIRRQYEIGTQGPYRIEVLAEPEPNLDRLALSVRTPDGVLHRWAEDEPDVENIPQDLSWSKGIPGGDKELSCSLLRDMGQRAADLDRFNDVQAYGPGVETRWRGYLVKTPDKPGQVSPAAVGDAGYFKDDPTLRAIGVDRDLSHWDEPSYEWLLEVLNAGRKVGSFEVAGDPDNGLPALRLSIQGPWDSGGIRAAAVYASRGIPIGSVHYARAKLGGSNLSWRIGHRANADYESTLSAGEATGTIDTPASGDLAATAAAYYTEVMLYKLTEQTASSETSDGWREIAITGTEIPTVDDPNSAMPAVLGPDVYRWLIDRTRSPITYTDESIEADTFPIPHLVWLDPTTAEQGLLDVARYFRKIWAIYDRVFRSATPETFGRLWHVRRSEGARIESNGPDAEQTFNGVVVKYDDPSGQPYYVGPPESGLVGPIGLPTATLVDLDEENPLNLWGRRRWAVLDAGLTSEPGAIRLGERFLELTAARQVSGSLDVEYGQLLDPCGVRYPAWAADAGDRIVEIESHDRTERLVVDAGYTHRERDGSLTLDAPPDELEAILERLQVVLVGIVD